MGDITFTASPWCAPADAAVARGHLITLPAYASQLLATRGMSYAHVTLGPHEFGTAIEPDGDGSHWFAIPPDVVSELASTVTVTIRPSRDWPEPAVPADIDAVLAADPAAQAIWNDITPAARWDWVRWAGTARQPETRARRVSSIPSRLRAGKRRPCCFDRNQCSLTVA